MNSFPGFPYTSTVQPRTLVCLTSVFRMGTGKPHHYGRSYPKISNIFIKLSAYKADMPLKYKNLAIIGTSHIAKQSIREVKEAIEKKPDIVAVELDSNRLRAIKEKGRTKLRLRDIFKIGIVGFVFALVGAWAQRKLGKLVGVTPGTEMLTAVRLARKNKINIALIDQDITLTLAKLSRAVTWKEKLRFPYDIIKAVFFRKKELRRLGIEDLDLSKVPEKKIIKVLTAELKKCYPNVYRILVKERNMYMAKRLDGMISSYPNKKILAVVGAGHEEELLDLIKKKEKEEKIIYEFSISK